MAPQGLSSVWDRDFPLAVQMLGSERGMLFHCSLLLVQAKGKDTCPKAAGGSQRPPVLTPPAGGGEVGLGRGLRALFWFS